MAAAQLGVAVVAPKRAAAQEPSFVVGVVDARAPDADPRLRSDLLDWLRLQPSLLPADAQLAAALAGLTPAIEAEERASWARMIATNEYQALHCPEASAAAEEASLALLAARDQRAARDELGYLLAIMLLCADQAGDHSAAFVAAARLRALGLGLTATPPGVADAVWARYPDVDAVSNQRVVKVEVAAGEDVEVWVDLVPMGRASATAPLELLLAPGRHWIAAAGSKLRVARVEEIARAGRIELELALPVTFAQNRWRSLAEVVAGWRRAGRIDETSLLQAMRDAELVVTVVLMPDGRAQIWTDAARVAEVDPRDEKALAAGLEQAAAALPPRAPYGLPHDPAHEAKLAKKRAAREGKGGKVETWHWLFLGALVAGAVTVFVVTETGDSFQRIEVSWP